MTPAHKATGNKQFFGGGEEKNDVNAGMTPMNKTSPNRAPNWEENNGEQQ